MAETQTGMFEEDRDDAFLGNMSEESGDDNEDPSEPGDEEDSK